MALPITGISTSLVKTAIGAGSNDVGTLCTHPNVNKWSKWKPVKLAKVIPITLSDLQSVNFGIDVVSATTVSTLVSAIASAGYDVRYTKPTGGATSPYRLGDFRSYHNDAVIPCGTSNAGTVVKIEKGSARYDNKSYLTYYDGIEVTDSDVNVEMEDLYPLPIYRGIMLTNGVTRYWKTGPIEWNDPLIKYWTGTTQAFQFYTNKEQLTLRGATSADTGAMFYAMPTDTNNQNPYTLNVTDDYGQGTKRYDLSITAVKNQGIVSYTVRFDARSYVAGGDYLSNVYVYLYAGSTQLDVDSHGSYNLLDDTYIDYTGTFQTLETGNLTVRVFENSAEQGWANVITQA